MAFKCPYKDQNKNCLMSNVTGIKKCINPTPCVYVFDDFQDDLKEKIENGY